MLWLWEPLPYFRPKYVIFPSLFQTWPKIWYPISDQTLTPSRLRKHLREGFKFPMLIKPQFFGEENNQKIASCKNHTRSHVRVHKPHSILDQNRSKSIPYFRPKKLKNHTLWRRTYLYNLYKGVSPRAFEYFVRCDFCQHFATLLSTQIYLLSPSV